MRRKKLIRPRIQLKMILAFLGVAFLALLLQFLLFQSTLSVLSRGHAARRRESCSSASRGTRCWCSAISVAILLPLTFFVGVIVTFRIRGADPPLRHALAGDRARRGSGHVPHPQERRTAGFSKTLNAALDRLKQGPRGSGVAEPAADFRARTSGLTHGVRMSLRSKIVADPLGRRAAVCSRRPRDPAHCSSLQSFVGLENARAEKDLQRVAHALKSEVDRVDRDCKYWAGTDELTASRADGNRSSWGRRSCRKRNREPRTTHLL
jgi:hypothetical protein